MGVAGVRPDEAVTCWPDGKQIACVAKLWQNLEMAHASSSIGISTRQSGGSTVVDIDGDITLRSTPDVRKALLGLFRDKSTVRVLVNLTKVRYIDSAGIASLVEALRLSRDTNRGLALFGLNNAARQVLELTRLTKVFDIYQDEEEALRGRTPGAPSA